jgi:hypothetical protein
MRLPCTLETWWPLRSQSEYETEERLGHNVVVQSDIAAETPLPEGPGLAPAI